MTQRHCMRHFGMYIATAVLLALAAPGIAQHQQQQGRDEPRERPAEGRAGQIQMQPNTPPPPPPPPAPPPSKPMPADLYQVRIVVFQVTLPPDKIASLDVSEMAKQAPTAAACEKLLAGLGSTRALYRIDQALSRREPKIMFETDRPMVTGRQGGADGPFANTLSRDQARFSFELAPLSPGDGPGPSPVAAEISLSTFGDSDVKVADDLRAPLRRRVSQSWAGEANGAPALLLSVTADEGRADATAFVTWLSVARVP